MQSTFFLFFANSFCYLERLHKVSKSAQLGHGIGPKSSYYTKSNKAMTVRFVEGAYRLARLESMYPDDKFIDVGFCKLDPVFNNEKTTFLHIICLYINKFIRSNV
mgnify:CR=1 FL=1